MRVCTLVPACVLCVCVICALSPFPLQSITAGPQGPMGYNGSAGPQGPRGEAGPEAVGGRINLNDYCRTEHKECTITGGSCDTIMTVAPVSLHMSIHMLSYE